MLYVNMIYTRTTAFQYNLIKASLIIDKLDFLFGIAESDSLALNYTEMNMNRDFDDFDYDADHLIIQPL